MNTHYQLIVFDWDGTLMDSTAHIVYCMREAIKQLSLMPLSDHDIRQIIGLGLQEAVYTLYPQADQTTWTALANTYREVWINSTENTPLFEPAMPLLDDLAKQRLFLGVATGKSRRGLDRALNNTGLHEHFIATRCADECRSKPHPQMLHELMDYVGVVPEKTLVIGDTEFDLMMAHNAGADSVGVLTGAHDKARLSECNPVAIFEDLAGVHKWLRQS